MRLTEATLWAKGLIRRARVPFAWVALADELGEASLRAFMRELGRDMLRAYMEVRHHG